MTLSHEHDWDYRSPNGYGWAVRICHDCGDMEKFSRDDYHMLAQGLRLGAFTVAAEGPWRQEPDKSWAFAVRILQEMADYLDPEGSLTGVKEDYMKGYEVD